MGRRAATLGLFGLAFIVRHHVNSGDGSHDDGGFVIDTHDLTREDRVSVCRRALRLITEDVGSFETDIPWGRAAQWPPEVVEAGHELEGRPGNRHGTAHSGVRAATDSDAWDAFLTIAPYALDATVWDVRGPIIADLRDEAATQVFFLNHQQRQALLEGVDVARVHPLTKGDGWRRWARNGRA